MGKCLQLWPLSSQLVFILLALCIYPAVTLVHSSASHVKSAYYYFGGGVTPSNIDTTLFTHLYYAFATMDPVTYQVKTASDDTYGTISTFSATVRATNPALKTLVSNGVGSSNITSFFTMITMSQTFILMRMRLSTTG